MTTTARSRATTNVPMDSMRKTALVAGLFYILTFISIPTLALYSSVHDADYILGSGSESAVIFGGVLEFVVALAGIATAVVLYPVVKRQNEGMALGLVASRTLEAAAMFAGVASLLSIVTLRQDGAGTDSVVIGQTLVAFYDSMFHVSQGFIPAVNALLLGTLLYRSRLVPRALPTLGLIGAVLLVTSDAGSLCGFWGWKSTVAALATLPIATWEFGLGVWLVVKGFSTCAITSESATDARRETGNMRVSLG